MSTSFYGAGNYESQQRRGSQRLSTLNFHNGKPHFPIHRRGWKESTSFYVAENYESQQRRGLQRLSTLNFHSGKPHFPHSSPRVEREHQFLLAGNYESQQRRGLQRLSTLIFHSGKPHFPHSLLRVESERLFRRVWKLLKPATAGPPATFDPRETCHFHFPPTMKIRGSCRINLLRVDGLRGVWVSVSRSGCWRCQGRIGQFGIAALSSERARGCRYAAMMAVWALARWGDTWKSKRCAPASSGHDSSEWQVLCAGA